MGRERAFTIAFEAAADRPTERKPRRFPHDAIREAPLPPVVEGCRHTWAYLNAMKLHEYCTTCHSVR